MDLSFIFLYVKAFSCIVRLEITGSCSEQSFRFSYYEKAPLAQGFIKVKMQLFLDFFIKVYHDVPADNHIKMT